MAMIAHLKIDSPEGRLCCHCKKIKPWSKYTKDRGPTGYKGFRRECKDCANERARRYYQNNKEKICARTREHHKKCRLNPGRKEKERDYHLKCTYGITLEEYDKMLEKQCGNCVICGLPELMKRLSVDHDHKTGKVRALLCDRCNRALGTVGDSVELLKKLIKYLRSF